MNIANQIGKITKQFNIGKTQIKICTDYCVKSRLEINEILENISENILKNANSVLSDEQENF